MSLKEIVQSIEVLNMVIPQASYNSQVGRFSEAVISQ